jgi:hypothetical protein
MVVPKAVRVALPAAVTLVVAAKVSVTCAGTVTTAARASAPVPLPDGAVAGSSERQRNGCVGRHDDRRRAERHRGAEADRAALDAQADVTVGRNAACECVC